MYFGGVEGGATHSNLIICDETGKVLGKSKGPGTNHWQLGIEECANRIVKMVHAAKDDAGIPQNRPLDSLGLTLSGCGQESSNAELAAKVQETDPNCAKAIYVATDTAGSLFTGAPNGGMVLIAGTGSNSLLRTPDGKHYGCGGWGHLLGDEGGAYWIAHRAVKTVFDEEDGLRPSPHPIHRVWEVIKEHFGVDNRDDLLPHAYKHFEKSMFAGLTLKLSQLAYSGDELSRHLLAETGSALAAHVVALAQRANATRLRVVCLTLKLSQLAYSGDELSRHLLAEAGSALAAHVVALAQRANATRLRVVCVGSVWHSWDVLKPGVLSEFAARRLNTELELVRLRVSSAMGAAWLAAKHINYTLPRDDSAFCQVFYTYTPDHHTHTPDRKENGTSDTHTNGVRENGAARENGVVQNGAKVNGLNGHHNGVETCGCGDWRNWS